MAQTTGRFRKEFESLVLGTPEFSGENFQLTSDEQYHEVLQHISDHKYLTNERIPYEISMRDAVYSWYENVYEPISRAIDQEGLAGAFPGHSRAELYLWVCRHWHYLKEESRREVGAAEAVCSFGSQFAHRSFSRFMYRLKTFTAA
ncbi:DUF4032 domain-containing protein [Spirochaeta lutea]|uniref:Uncharacterized protein n=1 Tax=Spirochaeta lutea TaxID=1480694 RepID=A0A098QZH9_9SPIO|nr:DUF4032 domain-containing protein [Spirochaeta lutea]KGE72818.1 hypothetical protein DC28_05435 [Spirochaeta lutea]